MTSTFIYSILTLVYSAFANTHRLCIFPRLSCPCRDHTKCHAEPPSSLFSVNPPETRPHDDRPHRLGGGQASHKV